MEKRLFCSLICALLMTVFTGCGLSGRSTEKLRDLDYTVVSEEGIPQELLAQIDENKEH